MCDTPFKMDGSWILSNTDYSYLMDMLHATEDEWRVMYEKFVSMKNLTVALGTFSSGLDVFLAMVCLHNRADVLQYFLETYPNMWNIDSLISINNKDLTSNKGNVEAFLFNNLHQHTTMYQPPCQSKQVRTLLCYAAASGHIDVVNVLLEFGASVDMTDCCELTPLMACCEYNCQPLVECSCEYKSISIETRPKILSLLASKSANLNHRAQCGMTPLMYASLRAPLLLHRLIKEGASIHLTDDFGFTALPYAILGGNNDALLYLLQLQADVLFQNTSTIPWPIQESTEPLELYYLSGKYSKSKQGHSIVTLLINHPQCPDIVRAEVVALITLFHTIKKLKSLSDRATCNLQLERNILQELLNFRQQNLQNFKESFDIILLLQTELNGVEAVNLPQLILLTELMVEKGYLSFLNYIVGYIGVGLHPDNCASDRKGTVSLLVKMSELFLSICRRHKAKLVYDPHFILPLIEQCLFLTQSLVSFKDVLGKSWTTLGEEVLFNVIETIILINEIIQQFRPHSHNTPILLRPFYSFIFTILNSWIEADSLSPLAKDIIHRYICHCPPTLTLAKRPNDSYNLCSAISFAFTANCTDPVKFIKYILQCGGKELVNSPSLYGGCRPLSLAIMLSCNWDQSIALSSIGIFLNFGAHVDAVDQLDVGFVLKSPALINILELDTPLDLSCLVAKTILQFDIPYKNCLPPHIVNFIELHDIRVFNFV